MMTEPQKPDFLFVCDHGDSGGHVDRVGLLLWFAEDDTWWAGEGADERSISVWPLHGNKLAGRDPWRLVANYEPRPQDEVMRFNFEIECTESRCTTWSYRSDQADLQELLGQIAAETDRPCPECGEPFALTIMASSQLIVMKLQQMHLAREHAKRHYSLHTR